MTETEIISKFSSRRLSRLRKAWINQIDCKIDLKQQEKLIEDFYSSLKLPKPIIFRCNSPWQVQAMPFLVQILARCESAVELVNSFDAGEDSKKWKALAKQTFSELERLKRDYPDNHILKLEEPAHIWGQINSDIGKSCTSAVEILSSTLSERLSPGLFDQLHSEFESATTIRQLHEVSIPPRPGRRIRRSYSGAKRRRRSSGRQYLMRRKEGAYAVQEFLVRNSVFSVSLISDFIDQLSQLDQMRIERLVVRTESLDFIHDTDNYLKLLFQNNARDANRLWWGNWSLGYLPLYQSISNEMGILYHEFEQEPFKADLILSLARQIFCVVFYDQVCFISEPPQSIQLNDENDAHNENGPAVVLRDGQELFSLYGIAAPEEIIRNPGMLDANYIRDTENIEVRRVLLRHYGEAKYLNELGATEYQSDQSGTLYRLEMTDDEPLVMVKVINSTAEPDGSFKSYFIRVPPNIETAREAVAWTFGLQASQYEPEIET